MDYKKIAQDILDNVGGKENIKTMTHCFTRLRFVLKDSKKADKAVVERLEGVIQVVVAGGQFQVVLGSKVNKVYDQAVALVGGEVEETETDIPEEKQPLGAVLLQKIGEIFTPIVPAIAASGLIKGLLAAVARLGWVDSSTSTYIIMNAASNAIFYFMPIFLAYTTSKALKCNQVIGMILGAFLCMPAIDSMMLDAATKSTIFGLPVIKMAFQIGESAAKVFAYTESVIPIILAIIVFSYLEKGLKKVIPEILHLVFVPGISLIVMLPVMLTIVGPVGIYIGVAIQWVYNAMMGISPLLGGAVVGGLWGVCVIFGAHRALLPIGLNDVAVSAGSMPCGTGHNTLMCYAGSANFAQAGAALGVMLKTKNANTKQVAASGFISAALVGVTEPAIYGVNLRLKKPMVCAVIAGAMGGAIMGIGGASNHGFANNGILTIPAYQCPSNTTGQFVAFLIGICVAFFGAAILTYIVGFDDDPMPGSEKKSTPAVAAPVVGNATVSSPVAGKAVSLTEVKDEVFASESMGKGIGVVPSKGEIVAPEGCTVEMIADTKHAIGLTLDSGVELLIHIGIDTVKLNGEHFTQHVQAGTHVAKGTKLVSFDKDKIAAAGYDTTVMVIVSNTDDYADVKADVANATLTVVR